MQLQEKKQFVQEFKQHLEKFDSFILVNYQGLDVNSSNELRQSLKKSGCVMKIIKNRLAVRAIKEVANEDYTEMLGVFNGPTAVLLAGKEPSEAIKIFKKFAGENKLMEFKAAVIGGNFLEKSNLEKLATLPSREVLLSQVVGLFNTPIQKLYNSLTGILTKIVYALNDLKSKLEKDEVGNVEKVKEENKEQEEEDGS